mmetsp:Transcript_1651/g.1964  ORF Transcript_1651/g.1964 Transcript_1651/m.1964 type:complete len:217 (+) Transcript_1651:515-1165(+)
MQETIQECNTKTGSARKKQSKNYKNWKKADKAPAPFLTPSSDPSSKSSELDIDEDGMLMKPLFYDSVQDETNGKDVPVELNSPSSSSLDSEQCIDEYDEYDFTDENYDDIVNAHIDYGTIEKEMSAFHESFPSKLSRRLSRRQNSLSPFFLLSLQRNCCLYFLPRNNKSLCFRSHNVTGLRKKKSRKVVVLPETQNTSQVTRKRLSGKGSIDFIAQ